MDSVALTRNIEAVFPAQPVPSMTLRQAVLADQSLNRLISQSEWDAEGQRDRDAPWPTLSDDALMECEDGVAHLDDESFAYYLGALLRFAVRHMAVDLLGKQARLVGTAFFSVTNRSNYNLSRLKRLNDAQIDCVIEFLRFVESHSEVHGSDAAKALKRYWLKPQARQKTIIDAP